MSEFYGVAVASPCNWGEREIERDRERYREREQNKHRTKEKKQKHRERARERERERGSKPLTVFFGGDCPGNEREQKRIERRAQTRLARLTVARLCPSC